MTAEPRAQVRDAPPCQSTAAPRIVVCKKKEVLTVWPVRRCQIYPNVHDLVANHIFTNWNLLHDFTVPTPELDRNIRCWVQAHSLLQRPQPRARVQWLIYIYFLDFFIIYFTFCFRFSTGGPRASLPMVNSRIDPRPPPCRLGVKRMDDKGWTSIRWI